MIEPRALIAGLLLVREAAVEAFPEGEVEIVLGLDLDLVAGAEHARAAEIVEHRIGRDLGGKRVVEADIGGDLGALDRLEQVDDDDRDAGRVGLRRAPASRSPPRSARSRSRRPAAGSCPR